MNASIITLAQELGGALSIRQGIVTTAESCTAGGVAQAITSVAGSSDWFKVGYVTYSNEAKRVELGVSSEILHLKGAVSEEVVAQMAEGALRKAGASLSVAVSGIAGPDGGAGEKPVGTVWFAWAAGGGTIITECCCFVGDRASVREQAVIRALQGLVEALESDL